MDFNTTKSLETASFAKLELPDKKDGNVQKLVRWFQGPPKCYSLDAGFENDFKHYQKQQKKFVCACKHMNSYYVNIFSLAMDGEREWDLNQHITKWIAPEELKLYYSEFRSNRKALSDQKRELGASVSETLGNLEKECKRTMREMQTTWEEMIKSMEVMEQRKGAQRMLVEKRASKPKVDNARLSSEESVGLFNAKTTACQEALEKAKTFPDLFEKALQDLIFQEKKALTTMGKMKV